MDRKRLAQLAFSVARMQREQDEIEREANRVASENELRDLRSPEVEGAHTSNSKDTGGLF